MTPVNSAVGSDNQGGYRHLVVLQDRAEDDEDTNHLQEAMEGALDEKRRTAEQGGERPGQCYGEVDVPFGHVLGSAAPRPGEAEAYDAGCDHQRSRKPESSPTSHR